ncbi:MAG: hypothetical protein Q4G46_13375, partial [Propionibacteriaceae bacterium]|nr:hypothetical protein [Propionibacteriaceae bacterium]
LAAERTLTGSLAAPIERQETEPTPVLPAAYGQRAQQTVTRAWSLLHAVETALAEPPAALHAHGEQERHTALRTLRDAVDAALASAVTWPGDRGR